MSRPAIRVENLSKAYRIGLKEQIPDTITGALTGWMKSPLTNLKRLRRLNTYGDDNDGDDTLWALKDVSFDVQEGEVLGVIGRNGAGKSTLLKILSRITEPTTGSIRLRGRVSSLLEVGTGFHPELTGRENVYMNGTILGMTKKEIDRKFDEIVDFSGVEKFLDTPVKRYSSGMKVRLAFAVAAHLEPEILIIDEVLAVGDVEFQERCLGKMRSVASHGRTVLFVSHNLDAVQLLCGTGIVLSKGGVQFIGPVPYAIASYLHQDRRISATSSDLRLHSGRRPGCESILASISMQARNPGALKSIAIGQPAQISVTYQMTGNTFAPHLSIVVRHSHGVAVCWLSSRLDKQYCDSRRTLPSGVISCDFASVPLMPGQYCVDLYLGDGRRDYDAIEGAATFEVVASPILEQGLLPDGSRTGHVVLTSPTWELSAYCQRGPTISGGTDNSSASAEYAR